MYSRTAGIWMQRLARLTATGFYSGYFPIAPGTVGSLIAAVLTGLVPASQSILFPLFIGLFYFIGVWASSEVEKTHGHDASVINLDEMIGMWISVLFLPMRMNLFWLGGAFLLFRLYDIIKPFPANDAQKLPRGWGVMTDDVAAGVYANVSLRLVHWAVARVF